MILEMAGKTPPFPSKCLCIATTIMVQRHLMGTEAVSLNTVLEYVDKLDIEDQQYLRRSSTAAYRRKTISSCTPGKPGERKCAETHEPERNSKRSSDYLIQK